ncbi:transporter substrate-binding domain-containing protein [Novosphingobium sp. BL-8H]|uniref:transporter substrate-binding domain-containing protein n=1 Tax=Novosphingobium sp. BL-8H TaxID=3127640 RepID=UPI003757E95D
MADRPYLDRRAQYRAHGKTRRQVIATALACASLTGLLASGCSQPKEQSKTPDRKEVATAAAVDATPTYEQGLPPDMRKLMDIKFTGDFDALVARRLIRVGVPFNRTFYFIDKGVQRGLSFEYLTMLEQDLNKRQPPGSLKIHVVPIPMPRDALLPALRDGRVDMVIAQLTITPERQSLIDFTNPTRTGVSEVLVTGPGAAAVHSTEDLAGKTIFVRKSSSYYSSLQKLNATLKAASKKPVDIRAAPESLEDDDLLEMVNAGLIPATIVDDYLARFWKSVFSNIQIHDDVAVRRDGSLAVGIRKDSPQMMANLNQFIRDKGLNSAIGRVLQKKYLQNTDFVKDAASTAERQKFLNLAGLFRRYGGEYDFDYLLMAAQGYQESRLNNDAHSPVGAIGIMQLMPKTGETQNVGDIRQLEPNIHAGVKYMRFLRSRYFDNEPMDPLNKALFTFAAYNAGAGRIAQLRAIAKERGLNPNIWFGNVERIAMEKIGTETTTYVSNIYKYYVAYSLIQEAREQKAAAKASITGHAAGT